ncbi:hypothetical protein [Candidatus Leptofilum sp.]|uniref:hypothetical protein n=1 Tax=Candidatus Leptofilum sp. TaxID=3241576 RepID=UPI003B5C3F86
MVLRFFFCQFATRIQIAAYNERNKIVKGVTLSTGTISFFAIFAFAMTFLGFYLRSRDRKRIRAYLEKHNCELLSVVWLSQSYKTPWNSGGYAVTFVNDKNELYRAKCFSVSFTELAWSEPELMYTVNSWQLEQLKESRRPFPDQMPFEEKSDRETIIDGLTSSFKHERIWAAEQLLELEIVDWEMRRLLDALAVDDEEPDVREAATKIIKKLQIIDEG